MLLTANNQNGWQMVSNQPATCVPISSFINVTQMETKSNTRVMCHFCSPPASECPHYAGTDPPPHSACMGSLCAPTLTCEGTTFALVMPSVIKVCLVICYAIKVCLLFCAIDEGWRVLPSFSGVSIDLIGATPALSSTILHAKAGKISNHMATLWLQLDFVLVVIVPFM